ncbi:MAG: TonB-dependent receptor, partial [Chitinophagaceae bacterium]|nr:TonB-dependent receptor [Chitinophagaceae bacterium]
NKNNAASGIDGLVAFGLIPIYPDLLNEDGSIKWKYNGYSLAAPIRNPMQYLRRKYSIQSDNLIGNMLLSYEIIPGLSVKSSFGYNSMKSSENAQTPKAAMEPRQDRTGSSSFGSNSFQTWIIEPRIDYSSSLIGGNLSILVGSTLQYQSNSSTTISGDGYTDDDLLESLQAAGLTANPGSSYSSYKYAALFGRISYNYRNKYILNLNARRDGSSRFGPGKQYGNFGSVGGAYLFSETKFFKKKFPGLSYGKLRASYGTTGSDNIGDYQYQANWGLTDVAYQGTRALRAMNLYNPNYSWAVTRKAEAGLELGFVKDRFLFYTGYYKNTSGNQLVSYVLPGQTGFSSVIKNFEATVENKGWEFQLNTTNIKTSAFCWTTSANLTIPQN